MEEFRPAPTEKTGIQPKDVINWGLVIIGGFLIYKIFRGTGLIKSVSEQKQDQLEQDIEDAANNAQFTNITKYTDPNFWKQKAPAGYSREIYSVQDGIKWANEMFSTHGIFNDDEEKMLTLIKNIQYQTQYSFLVWIFSAVHKQDLTTWLKNYFSGDFEQVIAHLKGIPTYKKI